MLAQNFVQVGMIMYYHLNKTYITNQLCENKKNPSLHCNGRCFLSKQLKKAEEGEKKHATFLVKEKEEFCSNTDLYASVKSVPVVTVPQYALYKPSILSDTFYTDLVKPPAT